MVIVALVLTVIIGCASNGYKNTTAVKQSAKQLHNFFKIKDSLYRAAQPSANGFLEMQQIGIKAILNLRDDEVDSSRASNTNLILYTLPITTDAATLQNIVEALRIIKNAPKPLCIHCKHGADRTGVVVAMYRIVFEGLSKDAAIKEMVQGPFGFHHQYVNLIKLIKDADIEQIKKELE